MNFKNKEYYQFCSVKNLIHILKYRKILTLAPGMEKYKTYIKF